MQVVDEHDARRIVERVSDQAADRLEKSLSRPGLVEARRRGGPEIGKQPRRIPAKRLGNIAGVIADCRPQ